MELENHGQGVYKTCSDIKANHKDEDLINTAYSLLLKFLANIIKNPNDPKFRIFKKSNENIKAKILCIKETETLLKEIGFVEEDGNLVFKNSKVDSIQKGVNVIETFKKEIDEKVRLKQEHKQNLEQIKLNEDVNARMREEAKKKKEILALLEQDKKERATRDKATDSVSNDLKFGATLKKFECKQPRG